ncbi:MAG: hypothetical protein GSR73_02890 [Desulfurococcales archaeon]|nr:hypothetical protein [Desulfurococcales archaeon]
MESKSGFSVAIAIIGALIILAGIAIAYQAYSSYSVELVKEDLEANLSYVLQTLAVVGLKGVFLGIMIWAGSILLRYGLENWKVECPVTRGSEER